MPPLREQCSACGTAVWWNTMSTALGGVRVCLSCATGIAPADSNQEEWRQLELPEMERRYAKS